VNAIEPTTLAPSQDEMTGQSRKDVAPMDPSADAELTQRFEMGRVLSLAVTHGLHDTYQGFLPPLLPAFITNLSLSKAEAGLLALLLDMPSLLQPFIGHWADRVNLRFLVILSPAVTIVMMSLLGTASSYRLLALLLILAGISRAAFHAVGPVVVGRLSGRRLGRGMGLWMIGGRLGPTLGPILAVTVVQILGLRGVSWLMLPGLLASAGVYWLLKDVSLAPTQPNLQPFSMQSLMAMAPLMLLVTSIVTIQSFLTSALSIYLPTYLTEQGAELWFAGVALSVLQGTSTIGVVVTGALSDRIGRRFALLIAFVTAPAFMLLFLRASGWIQLPFLALLGLTAMSTMPVFMALVQERFPSNRALANGLYLALSFVIRSVVGVLVGAMGDRVGLHWMFTAGAAIVLLGVPLIWLLPTENAQSHRGL
jgi:FSR family fosmidomycin resistance protein-like MFS transporter